MNIDPGVSGVEGPDQRVGPNRNARQSWELARGAPVQVSPGLSLSANAVLREITNRQLLGHGVGKLALGVVVEIGQRQHDDPQTRRYGGLRD